MAPPWLVPNTELPIVLARARFRLEVVRDALSDLRTKRVEYGALSRTVRVARGMSLREVARRCKISPAFLSDFERGRRWSEGLATKLEALLK